MKKLHYLIVLIVVLNCFWDKQCYAQKFADKDYYLVDSIVLDELEENDRIILDNSLKIYHTAKHDTSKILAIHIIVDEIFSKTLAEKYNIWVYNYIEGQLKMKQSIQVEKFLHKYFSLGISNLGYINAEKGNLIKALESFHQSLKLSKKIEDIEGVANALNNIGMIHERQGNLSDALSYFKKSLSIQEKIGDRIETAKLLSNVGGIYHEKAELEKALSYYQKSLNLLDKEEDLRGLSILSNNIGDIYKDMGDGSKSKVYFKKAVQIDELIGDDPGLSVSLNNLAVVLFEEGKIALAKDHAERSLSIAKKIGYPYQISNTSSVLSRIYLKEGKGVQALEMYQLHIQMRDSINNIETQKAVIKQQTKYEYEKKKALDDAENEKLVAIEKEAKQRQQIITYATVGFLALTGIFLFIVFNRLRITRKQKLIIENQKVEVETQKNEAETQRDIANSQKLIVEIKNKEILESITYAKRIQEAILPPPRLVKEWLTESFIFYKPKDIVAGDFYWMETATYKAEGKEKTLVYFAAADCTGHGVPGAMVSVVCANALNRAVKEFGLVDPGHVLDKVTELVVESFDKGDEIIKDGMDIALCALDISTKKVFYSGANNPLYRITKIDRKHKIDAKTVTNETHQLIEYKATKQPIGQHDNLVNFNTLEIQLEPGDAIYIFSDGFPDQFGGAKGKKYKYSSFRKSLLANFHHPMAAQKQLLEKEFETWKGDLEQIDDVCVIGVKINGIEKNNFTKRELEALTYLQEGLPSKLIADKMCISKHTVDTYRQRLLAKTGTYNTTELINYCIKKEII